MNLYFILGCAGLAGCLIAIILAVILHLMGKRKIIPMLLYLLCFALFIGGGFLYAHPDAAPVWEDLFRKEADEPAETDQTEKEPENQPEKEPENPPEEDGQSGGEDPGQSPAESLPSGEGYAVTYAGARVYTDSIGTVWSQVIVEIENTGSERLYVSSGSYDLEDGDGNLIASKSHVSTCPQIVDPGEKAYMYEESILDGGVDGEVTVVPRPAVSETALERIRFPVSGAELAAGRFGSLKALGRVENNTDQDSGVVYVVVILKNSSGRPVGQMYTIIDSLRAGEQAGFQASAFALPEDLTLDEVADFDVYAYPLQTQP